MTKSLDSKDDSKDSHKTVDIKDVPDIKVPEVPQNHITVVLVDTPEVKTIEMCRAALGNFFVFKKYVDFAMDFPQTHFTWKHWTSVRSSLMQEKYTSAGILSGVYKGSRILVFSKDSKLPNLAVSQSECYRIMC